MLVITVILVAVVVGINLLFVLMDGSMRQPDLKVIKRRLLGAPKSMQARTESTPALLKNSESDQHFLALRLLQRFRSGEYLRQLLEQAGMRWKVARLAHACLGGFLIGFGSVWYLAPPPFNRVAILSGLPFGALPIWYVRRKARARLGRFEEQFPDSLEFMSRSMRAGHAFSVSMEMLYREFDEPLASEFRRTFDEQNFGLPLDLALEKLAKRMPLLDVQFFVSAVLLQKRTGGNLAEILDKLAYLIRERFKLRGRIRAVSAHGRMTGKVLSLIPAAVAVLMFYVNPQYVNFFFGDPIGMCMLGGAVGLQLIGYAVINKIVQIEI